MNHVTEQMLMIVCVLVMVSSLIVSLKTIIKQYYDDRNSN